MLRSLPVEEILKILLSSKPTWAEIFCERSSSTVVTHNNKALENINRTSDIGVGLRVIRGDKSSYGATNNFDNLFDLAKKVADSKVNIRATRCNPSNYKTPPSSLKKKIEIVSRAAETAWRVNDKISQVKVTYSDKTRLIDVFSSDGNEKSAAGAHDEQCQTSLAVEVVAKDGDVIQTGFERAGGSLGMELFDENPPEKLAKTAAERAIRMLKAPCAKAGVMAVVLSSSAGGTMIHEAVGHGLEADLVTKGLSVYSGKIGQRVASPLIRVLDDATISGKRGSYIYDDEGTKAQKTLLIDKGVLAAYLTDKISAIKEKTANPTGNGRRQSYEFPPIVRMTNTMIAPGDDDPLKIIADTDSGIFVTKMGGGQVNTVNGDFVFEAQEAYLIQKGRIGTALRGVTLIGNGPEILKTIDRVGNDLGFSIGTCGKNGQEVPVSSAQPTLRIPKIVVGGVT